MALSNINFVTFCINAFHVHTETYRVSPDPSFPMRDTASDPRWGWLGLARETSDWVFYFQYGSIVLTGLCMGFYWSYMLLLKQAILVCSYCSNGHI